MNKAEKVQKVYEWLLEVYERTQEPISPHKAKFGELSTKYAVSRTYLSVAKENFFDKTLLASTNSGSYLWTSIRPNIKMAVRVIEECRKKDKAYRDAYDKRTEGKKQTIPTKKEAIGNWMEDNSPAQEPVVKTKKPRVLATTVESQSFNDWEAKQMKVISRPKKADVLIPKSTKDKYIRIAINVTKAKRYSFRLAEFVGAIGAYELIKYFINK